jgi:hypothetical protein
MPPKQQAIATHDVPRVSRTLSVKLSRHKGAPKLVVYVMDGTHRESLVWLSDTPSGLEQLAHALPHLALREDDLSEEFIAAMRRGSRRRDRIKLPVVFVPLPHQR